MGFLFRVQKYGCLLISIVVICINYYFLYDYVNDKFDAWWAWALLAVFAIFYTLYGAYIVNFYNAFNANSFILVCVLLPCDRKLYWTKQSKLLNHKQIIQ